MRFTDSPYETLMQRRPHPRPAPKQEAPAGTPCRGCCYWQGAACGTCYKELLRKEATSGQLGPK